ncbi:MAG: phenylacetic acid degradation bifunctional protein PaaZ [Nevskiaceae bacterium]|nr:MAG: phenylacetic acid degradation bifunctional protein PaaZ [Nevskiaceae bacterium]TBR74249.1 MAG: phenylacetic acid degradation bifunctional protein PaaZ [Nevskiaceae bacterium]
MDAKVKTNKLESYTCGHWQAGGGDGELMRHAVTGAPVAVVTSEGLDFGAMLDYGRRSGAALRRLTFHDRALRLKALGKHLAERKETYYALSAATGATRNDSWVDIEGGIATLFAYASKGRRELPNGTFIVDGAPEVVGKGGHFIGQHIAVPLHGVAVHINAFNFPCWGMLEKLSVNLLAGLPAIVKPASQTGYLTQLMFRDMVASKIFPEGTLQLICGGVGDLLDHLDGQDVVTFTGSASTGQRLRSHPAIVRNSVRFTMEADSLNCSILGPDAKPGTAEFDLFVREVAREMTIKAGQRCTAIRRAIAPRETLDAVIEAVGKRLDKVVVGDPAAQGVTMGALASLKQRDEVRSRVVELEATADLVYGSLDDFEVTGANAKDGAFLPPLLLRCADPKANAAVHDIEAFGPVSTVMPYDDTADAIDLAQRGRGSLVGSVFTADKGFARDVALGAAPFHGRLLFVDATCGKESTGHGSPLPMLVHGGPGRAGGGEEMGGVRGVMHYLQRTALQGSPDMLAAITGRFMPGATRHAGEHPFRKYLDELEIGDTVVTGTRTVTLADIEHFADFTGDTFYAHMDEEAAKKNPFFGGRVAHGYLIVSFAAGLFVSPEPGPVLANYGLDNLRFITPVHPGDTLQVTLTCKSKTPRATGDYGEVCWDTTVRNQKDELVAQYDVLTLVARKSTAGAQS